MRFPWTRRDALALENPSLELEVGTLINGRLRKNAAYFPASMTFPPPMEMTAWGISIERERKKMLLCAVILAGASTAFAGNIGFIGLLAPHAAKKVVGNGHRVSLLLASLIAAVMLIFADTVAGNLFSPIEIPAGIAVSLVGVPYFVYLMWKE